MSWRDKHRPGRSGWGRMRPFTPQNEGNMAPPPPDLKGKALGLYYRDQKRQNKKARQLEKRKKPQVVIQFRVPPAVEHRVATNILQINIIAEGMKIPINKPNLPLSSASRTSSKLPDAPVKDEVMDTVDLTEDPIVKSENEDKIEIEVKSEIEVNSETEVKSEIVTHSPVPGTSSVPEAICSKQSKAENSKKKEMAEAPEFIPVNQSNQSDYSSDCVEEGRLLSLRGAGDYKYGYEDIITGTFDEKLDESLLKGVDITRGTIEIQELSARYHNEYKEMLQKPKYKQMKEFRDRLPTFKKSQDLLDVINNNQVVVISGETGCGKSTQVPQIILDDAICRGKGGNTKILVTQPRRIAASSLAARVAAERAEAMGNSVGYAVRLEKIDARPRGSIMFVTTGILLADLEVNQGLANNSHVILDEVHERDCDMDLSMTMLKMVLKKRKDLKLILMSATIDAEKISAYFDDCPMLHIEGLAYPVKDIYLEQILEETGFQFDWEPKGNSRPEPKWWKYTNRGSKSQKEKEKQDAYREEISDWLRSIKNKISPSVYSNLVNVRIEDLNPFLIVELLKVICQKPPGAILVFLPGIGDITKVLNIMKDSLSFPANKYEIYPLHSKLPSLDQRKIFERPPPHIRKIILATNIAETSITIDDIVYVVDCGKLKYKGLNVEDNLTTLKTEWVSQANLRQRRGRAGRCQPGVCYHLLTTFRASTLDERLLPELQRSDLLEPVLSIKRLRLGKAAVALNLVPSPPAQSTIEWAVSHLQQSDLLEPVLSIKRLRLGKAAVALNLVPSPPAQSTIEWAVSHLQQCGALNDEEKLTPLGWHLARLPLHPAAGKLLLLGTLFGCLDRAASVAAVWGFKDPFQLVIGKEKEVDAARRRLALDEPSDHVAISEAIIQWEQTAPHRRYHFAYENFLQHNTIELLSEMKIQLANNLRQMGWLAAGDVKSSFENRNHNNLSLFKAIVSASLYPNVACARWKYHNRRLGTRVSLVEKKLMIHPSSVIAGYNRAAMSGNYNAKGGGNWMVYWLKQKSSEVYLIEVTVVYTLPLLFFGELKVCSDSDNQGCNEDEVDFKITDTRVRCNRQTAELLYELRAVLDHVLAAKVKSQTDYPTQDNPFEHRVLNSVIELITAEDEGADYMSDGDLEEMTDSDQSMSDREYHQPPNYRQPPKYRQPPRYQNLTWRK